MRLAAATALALLLALAACSSAPQDALAATCTENVSAIAVDDASNCEASPGTWTSYAINAAALSPGGKATATKTCAEADAEVPATQAAFDALPELVNADGKSDGDFARSGLCAKGTYTRTAADGTTTRFTLIWTKS